MSLAAATLVYRVVVIKMFLAVVILVHRVVVTKMFLAVVTLVHQVAATKMLLAAIKVLPHHHRNSLLILGRCYLAMVGLGETLGADIRLPLDCPSYRRCLVHPAVYLLNPQVKICQYFLI
jgi:hypothetical protein